MTRTIATTIDKAGRIVVPKAIRERLGLRGGDKLEIEDIEGAIVIRRPPDDSPLVETENGLLTMGAGPGLDPDGVREWLERTRR